MKTGLESIYPDNSRFSINMHYQSEATGEFGTLKVTKKSSIEDILAQYAKLFPIEATAFLEEVKLANQNLNRPGGMSKEGVVMILGKIPKLVLMAIEFVNPDYFMLDPKQGVRNFYRFFRAFPKFAIGEHLTAHR